MNPKQIITFFVAAIIIVTLGSAVMIQVGNTSTEIRTDSYSSSGDYLYTDSITLSPIEEAVTSTTVTTDESVHLSFDGSNDFINITPSGSTQINRSDYTMQIWVKAPAQAVPASGFIAALDGVGNANTTDLYLFTSGVPIARVESTAITATKTINDSNWHLLTLTADRDSTTGGRLYIDVLQNGSSANILSLNTSYIGYNKQMYIGRRAAGGYFNGSVDDLKIYNRVLNSYHIRALYNSSEHGSNLGKIVPIIYMHRIENNNSNGLMTNLSDFSQMMSYLNSSGFTTITLADFKSIRDRTMTMPAKPIVIMFDDGFKDVYTNATPIMDNYGFKGEVGVITRLVGTTNYMTWSDISALKDKGWGIANHFVNDTRAVEFDSSTLAALMNEAQSAIIGNTSYTPITFVYPGNEFNATTNTVCASIFTFCTGTAGSQNSPEYTFLSSSATNDGIRRIGFWNNTIIESFKSAVDFNYLQTMNLDMNENNGTTVYNKISSGGSGSGTISGATWVASGTRSLVSLVDYTVNSVTGTLTLLDSDYVYRSLSINWDYTDDLGSSLTTSVLNILIVVMAAGFLVVMYLYVRGFFNFS